MDNYLDCTDWKRNKRKLLQKAYKEMCDADLAGNETCPTSCDTLITPPKPKNNKQNTIPPMHKPINTNENFFKENQNWIISFGVIIFILILIIAIIYSTRRRRRRFILSNQRMDEANQLEFQDVPKLM